MQEGLLSLNFLKAKSILHQTIKREMFSQIHLIYFCFIDWVCYISLVLKYYKMIWKNKNNSRSKQGNRLLYAFWNHYSVLIWAEMMARELLTFISHLLQSFKDKFEVSGIGLNKSNLICAGQVYSSKTLNMGAFRLSASQFKKGKLSSALFKPFNFFV